MPELLINRIDLIKIKNSKNQISRQHYNLGGEKNKDIIKDPILGNLKSYRTIYKWHNNFATARIIDLPSNLPLMDLFESIKIRATHPQHPLITA